MDDGGTRKGGSGPGVRFRCAAPRPMARRRLFCFPYAGSGASAYRAWSGELPDTIEVMAAQLPGREDRLSEEPFRDWESLISSSVEAMAPHLGLPFALFGHSMGAVLALEVARRLRRDTRSSPTHLMVSGRPAQPKPEKGAIQLGDLPDTELIAALERRYGSLASTALAHPEIRPLALPSLRADLRLLEDHRERDEPPLECAITAYGGDGDPSMSLGDLPAWQRHTRGRFRDRVLPGAHFFVDSSRRELLADIAEVLEGDERA